MARPSGQRPTSLLLFTTSQTPLANRYPHPAKPALLLPPLVHTSLHNALDADAPSLTVTTSPSGARKVIIPNPRDSNPNGAPGTLSNGSSSSLSNKPSLNSLSSNGASSSTSGKDSFDSVPNTSIPQDEEKERSDNEITVKFYVVGQGSGSQASGADLGDFDLEEESGSSIVEEQQGWIREGLEALERYKRPRWGFGSGSSTSTDSNESSSKTSPTSDSFTRMGKIDTFLLGWKGIDYIGKKTQIEVDADGEGNDKDEEAASISRQPGCGSAKLASRAAAKREREESGGIEVSEEKQREMVELWKSLDDLVPTAVELGTLSLPLPLLKLLHSESNGVSPLGSSADIASKGTDAKVVPKAAQKVATEDERNTISSMSSSDPVVSEDTTDDPPVTVSASHTDRSLLSTFLESTNGATTVVPTLTGSESAQLDSLERKHQRRSKLGQVRKPKVNSLNTPDCHSLPEGLTSWAKAEGVELWAGGSGIGSDPMPSQHLHNTLAEFVPQCPVDFISHDSPLGKVIPFSERGEETPALGVDVRWVLGYTVISRTRNVLKDKGYIISAALL